MKDFHRLQFARAIQIPNGEFGHESAADAELTSDCAVASILCSTEGWVRVLMPEWPVRRTAILIHTVQTIQIQTKQIQQTNHVTGREVLRQYFGPGNLSPRRDFLEREELWRTL